MTVVNLTKGQNVSLTKDNPGLKKYNVGLGWDPQAASGADFDLDATVFMLNSTGKCPDEKHMIFYGNLKDLAESVCHSGDNRSGNGEGDDETIKIDFSKIPAGIERLAVIVTIHEGKDRNQNFGQVRNSYIRVLNGETNEVLHRYDLEEDYSVQTAVNFGELYLKDGEWKFKATGEGTPGSLKDFVLAYGLTVAE